MQYEKKNLGSYQLHLLRTTDFKSILVKVCFHNQIRRESVTERNFLVNMMLCSTEHIPSKKELSTRCQDLYAAQLSASNRRIGAFIDTSFTLSVLNDSYTEEGNFKRSLDLLEEVIFHPALKEKKFQEKDYEIIMHQMATDLESSRENLSRYSLTRALEVTDSKSPLSIRGEGYIEDLDKITPSTLYQHYKEMIEKDTIDIFVIGDIDFDEVTKEVMEVFRFKTFKREKGKALLEEPKLPKKPRIVVEKESLTQTKLVMVCRLCGLEEEERKYPLTLYNIILGGSGDSKLFQEVREKESLCYDIRSVPNKPDHVLLITAGIAKEKKKKAIKKIEEQLKKMAVGDFTEEEILKAKEFYLASFDVIEDSMSKLAESYYMMELLGVDDLEVKKKKMKEVSKEEIQEVAKKVKLDLIYTLEGGEYEETTNE